MERGQQLLNEDQGGVQEDSSKSRTFPPPYSTLAMNFNGSVLKNVPLRSCRWTSLGFCWISKR